MENPSYNNMPYTVDDAKIDPSKIGGLMGSTEVPADGDIVVSDKELQNLIDNVL